MLAARLGLQVVEAFADFALFGQPRSERPSGGASVTRTSSSSELLAHRVFTSSVTWSSPSSSHESLHEPPCAPHSQPLACLKSGKMSGWYFVRSWCQPKLVFDELGACHACAHWMPSHSGSTELHSR